MPVLRAALGDPEFFASRRHPVRRFVNRIASLGAAFEDYDSEQARGFLARVGELIEQVVEGDFDQIETYEQKLAELVNYTAEQAGAEAQAQGDAAALLAEKEDQLRLRQLYAQQMAGDLRTCRRRPSCSISSAASGARCCCTPRRRAAPTGRWRSACAASGANCS